MASLEPGEVLRTGARSRDRPHPFAATSRAPRTASPQTDSNLRDTPVTLAFPGRPLESIESTIGLREGVLAKLNDPQYKQVGVDRSLNCCSSPTSAV